MTMFATLGENITDYTVVLDACQIKYKGSGHWLLVGKPKPPVKWLIYISVIRAGAIPLLKSILPLLLRNQVPFRVIKNQFFHAQLNLGIYGRHNIGKVITLYPLDEEHAVKIVKLLTRLVQNYIGPRIYNTIQLGPVLYASIKSRGQAETNLKRVGLVPKRSDIPFPVGRNYWISESRRMIIGRYYIIVRRIRSSVKGNIYEAISFKGGRLKRVVIKEGKLNMVDDLLGRTIKDRLLWQKKVHNDLQKVIHIPAVVDYFEIGGDGFLVMNYIKGVALSSQIKTAYQEGRRWNELTVSQQLVILHYYLQILDIVERIHEANYVHRDIKDGNLLVLPDGKPCLLDFELSYCLNEDLPKPPFKMFTVGYSAPEQSSNEVPTTQEDIYSLGALLLYLISGIVPSQQQNEPVLDSLFTLNEDSNNISITTIISRCMNVDPTRRPILQDLRAFISEFVELKSG